MHKILLSSIFVMYSVTTFAVTMEEALTSGYNHNEELKSIRTDFLTEIEAFPRALAGFMPKISAGLNSTDSKVSSRNQIIRNNNRYIQSLTIEQPLFDGWSSVAELKSAQSGFRAARGDFYAKEQDAFLKEINAYLDCVEAREKYDISKISVKSNKTQLDAMKEKFKLGESTETEVASAREGLATAEANQALSYARYELAKAKFYQVFGVEAINIKMPTIPTNLPSSLEILTERAIAVNPSVDSAIHKTKSFKAGENIPKGKLLPRASFKLEHGNTYYNPQSQINDVNNQSSSATLSVTIPILERGGIEYSDVRKAKYNTRKSVIALDNTIKKIKTNCKGSWAELNAAAVRIKATDQAVKASEVAYDGMIQEEMLGSKTIIDVLRTEERLNKAREGRVESRKAMILAAYQIKSLIGELTAKSMELKVDYFNPEEEFKKVKMKIVGF
jgi:outer membrane protein